MSADKLDVHNAQLIRNGDNQSMLVALYVEYHAIASYKTGGHELSFNVLRV